MVRTLCSALLSLLMSCAGQVSFRASARVDAEGAANVREAPLRVGAVTIGDAATAMQVACEQGAPESCNALDDNCDGVIDEGCGLGSGRLQITAAWNTGADLDLYVVDPNEESLSFQRRQTRSGGHLDRDARGACREGQTHDRLENAVWPDDVIRGEYQVRLHYLFECDSTAGLTTATVSVAFEGRVISVVNVSVAPGGQVDALRFVIE